MQVKKITFTAFLSIVALCSCVNDGVEDDYGSKGAADENSISIDGVYSMGYLTSVSGSSSTKGTAITEGVDVTSIGIYTNVRTAGEDSAIELDTYLENSEIKRNIYGKLEFLDDAYWPVLEENQSLGFIAYSPYTDVEDGVGTTTASGLSDPESENMQNLYITYEVPSDVANQPDLLISEPVQQSSGSVSLVFNHALATIKFNVKGDGVHPVAKIEVSDIISRGRLHASYSIIDDTEYVPSFEWDTTPDGEAVQTKDFELSIDAETLSTVYPSDESTMVTSQTGYLMMIPQTVSAATEFLVTFTDGMSRSVRFFDNQVWEAGGIYSYNINISFEGDFIDFSDITTVNTLVANGTGTGDGSELETANCYILNPPVYSKEQELADAASDDDDEAVISALSSTSDTLVFMRSTGEEDDSTESLSTEEANYGALYYIPITTQMKKYYEDYKGDAIPAHDDWTPLVLWYDCPLSPTENGVIIKRIDATAGGEERFSVYIPYGYTNFGNISIGVKSDKGAIIWSWHLWITDYNPYYDRTLGYDAMASGYTGAYTVNVEGGELHHYRDNQATPVYYWSNEDYYRNRLIMDRNIGANNNGGGTHAEVAKTGGLYYQYARKDPFPRGGASTDYYTPVNRTYAISPNQVSDLDDAIETPLTFYDKGVGQNQANNSTYIYDHTWYKIADPNYVWGDKNYTNTDAGEYYKSLFDPSPLGFMVPTINVWNDFVLGSASTGITLSSTASGISYASGIYGDTTDDYLLAQYPLSCQIYGSTGAWSDSNWSACWTSTPINHIYGSGNHAHYNWANFMYFANTAITRYTAYNTVGSRTMGYNIRPIQRWYGTAPVKAHNED